MSDALSGSNARSRIIGIVYLLYFLSAIIALILVKGIVVSGDAVATAQNVLTHEAAFRASFASNLVSNVFYVALAALLYELFRPVGPKLSLIAAFLGLMGCAIQSVGSIFQLAPFVLADANVLPGFNEIQRQALSYFFMKMVSQAANVGLAFFAFYCISLGYLVVRSTFVPRMLGMLLMLAGIGWLAYLLPPLALQLTPYIQMIGFAAEAALMVWFLARGVPAEHWRPLREDRSLASIQ
jgi:uncharacterized protein DUF4386